MIKAILIPTDKNSILWLTWDDRLASCSKPIRLKGAQNIILIDPEAEIVEGHKYLYKETFLDGTVKTQEQFDNANWEIGICKKGDIPYIERARNGKNAQNGLLAVFKIIPCKLSPKSIQLLINYYNEHKCMPESVDVELESSKQIYCSNCNDILVYNDRNWKCIRCKTLHNDVIKYSIKLNQQGEVDITIPEMV